MFSKFIKWLTTYERSIKFSATSINVALRAQDKALQSGHFSINRQELLFALLQENSVRQILENCSVPLSQFSQKLEGHLQSKAQHSVTPGDVDCRLDKDTKQLMQHALFEAWNYPSLERSGDPEHILLGFLRYELKDSFANLLFQEYGVSLDKARAEVAKYLHSQAEAAKIETKINQPPIPAIPESGSFNFAQAKSSFALLWNFLIPFVVVLFLLWWQSR